MHGTIPKDFNVQQVIQHLTQNPLTQEILRHKLTRINQIVPSKQSNYLPDVRQLYQWLVVFNKHRDFREFIPTEKLQKEFVCDYIQQYVRYLMYCKQFRLEETMEYTQAIMLEAINFFMRYFGEYDKFPGMISIMKTVLELERLFFKMNLQDNRFHLMPLPSKEEEEQNKEFIGTLIEGHKVDALKVEHGTGRKIWSPAQVIKVGTQSVVICYEKDKSDNQKTIAKQSMEIFPLGTFTKGKFEWRNNLQVGDEVDYEFRKTFWKRGKVVRIQIQDDSDGEYKTITVEDSQGRPTYFLPVSPSIQLAGTFSREGVDIEQDYHLKGSVEDDGPDDYNDVLLCKNGFNQAGVGRQEICCKFFFVLLNYFHSINGFGVLIDKIKNPATHIDTIREILHFVCHISSTFHRRFALEYIPVLCETVIYSILHCSESNIRMFTKDHFNNILEDIFNLAKRYLTVRERHKMLEQIKMPIIKQFLDSEFLDRKLNSITMLTDLIKESKKQNTYLKTDPQELQQWFTENDIIHKIYHESTHPEVISRSSELLKLYLSGNPSIAILQPLLSDLSQPIIKVISQNSSGLPAQFLSRVATKLTAPDAKYNFTEEVISILKKVGGYQAWALSRGGEHWVDLVKSKKNRKQDMQILFQQNFSVVCKVFIEMIDKDMKMSKIFMNYAHNYEFIPKLIECDMEINSKLEFLKHYYREMQDADENDMQCFYLLWRQTYQIQNSKNFLETFKNIIHVLSFQQRRDFARQCFTQNVLKDISTYGFVIFKKVITLINTSDSDMMVQDLAGITDVKYIVFENQRIEVTKMALEFLFNIIENLRSQREITEEKEDVLKKCLDRLYETKNYEKYLSLLQGILNESEKSGNGGLEPLARQIPTLPLIFSIHNNFNAQNKNRFHLTVNSNTTLYQLRYLIGKHINAYGHQLRLTCCNANAQHHPIEQLLNGLTLGQIPSLLKNIFVSKKIKTKKAELTSGNKLVNDAVVIVAKLFNEYSIDGLMSKENCRRLIKRLGQDTAYMISHKVDKIFETYDTDKDEHLKVQDLIGYFEHVANIKPSHAWNMLEAIGAREDLKILDNVELTQPHPQSLPRYFLINNKQFMQLLFSLIKEDDKNGQIAWSLLFRLPIYPDDQQNLDKTTNFGLRYWLYLQDYFKKQEMDTNILNLAINSDQETLLMGLKVAERINLEINFQQLQSLLTRVQTYNKEKTISNVHQLILAYSLKLICKGMDNAGNMQEHLLNGDIKFEEMFMNGILSKNAMIRKPYLEAISGTLEVSRDSNPVIFKRLYVMLEKGLEIELTLLTSEYFELFSKVLILASNKEEFINEALEILNKIVKAFEEHESTEINLNSPEDQISIGFIKLINGLLLSSGIRRLGIITFLLDQCLFPQQNTGGSRKLRSHTSRKLAYDLIVTLCRNDNESLRQLFNYNFKKIYQKASAVKDSYWSPKIRSQYGYSGIQNLGCICYMISMLQQFFMVPSFRYLIMIADDKVAEEYVKVEQPQPYYFPMRSAAMKQERIIDDNILHQFQSLFASLQLLERQDVDPTDFCLSFKDFQGQPINVMVQQDAQQFLNMLFDKLETGIKETPFKNIINGIYGGKYCNQLVCSSCKKVSERHENFFSLSLEVKGHKNIYQSFAKYIQGQVISEYKCQGCNKKADTTKRSFISQLPNYFILHLQRICFNYDKFQNEKVNSRLEFPHDLDVYPFTLEAHGQQAKPISTEDYQYKLKGIVVHIGSAEYGHYFSYIRGNNDQWLEYNDENVREFDPSDIEDEAFGGGTGWRKDHQSAYLLVYEKVKKSDMKLEFENEEQKERILRLLKAIEVKKEQVTMEEQKPLEKMEEQTIKQRQSNDEPNQNPSQPKPVQATKIIAYIDSNTINQYVKPSHKQTINKSNQQFTLDIHLSTTQFLQFIFNISRLDTTVPDLKNELLLLCSEQYSNAQSICNGHLTLAQQLPKRFAQLIEGGGWQFYIQKRSKWKTSILEHEPSTRTATKNVMLSTIIDVMKSGIEERMQNVRDYLSDFWELSKSEEMEWYLERAVQYFDFWVELLELSPGVLHFFEENRALTDLLRFVINDKNFPLKIASKKRKFFDNHNEQPIKLIMRLIEKEYNMDKLEVKGISSFAFLTKITGQNVDASRILPKLCYNNHLISERVCYLLLTNFSKANHSNQIRPLATKTRLVLTIDDDLKTLRYEWLFGHCQLSEHSHEGFVGLYGLNTPDDQMRTYYSPLGIIPIPEALYLIKQKFEHVTVLMISMLLEFEKDGLINLRSFPSHESLTRDITHWFARFIALYKPAQGDIYKEYQNRAISLWKNREERDLDKGQVDEYLIGAVIEQKVLIRDNQALKQLPLYYKKPQNLDRRMEIKQYQYTVNICKPKYESDGQLKNGSNLVQRYNNGTMMFITEGIVLGNIDNALKFMRKQSNEYQHGSDQQQEEDEDPEILRTPFKNPQTSNYIRKMKFSNQSSSTRTIIVKLTFLTPEPNMSFPTSPCRFTLPPDQDLYFIVTKKDPAEDWPVYHLQWDQIEEKGGKRLHLFSNDEELPKEIFTPESDVEEREDDRGNEESEEEDDDDIYPAVGRMW